MDSRSSEQANSAFQPSTGQGTSSGDGFAQALPAVQSNGAGAGSAPPSKPKPRSRRKTTTPREDEDASKRRCVSTACIACRKRKSKCDGNTPACAACSQVYGTECVYDPNSDLRRKGVYKHDVDSLHTRNSTLQTLIQAILNCAEDDVPALVREMRTCESLDDVADRIVLKEQADEPDEDDDDDYMGAVGSDSSSQAPTFESALYGKMGDLMLDGGSVRYIGGTSNLIHVEEDNDERPNADDYQQQKEPITSWTDVTDDPALVLHLLNMYFTWHYTFFTTLSKSLFYRDFSLGRPPANNKRKTLYCTPLLVNAMLALGCHFTAHAGSRDKPEDSTTAGDHFFREAKRLIMENDEHEKPRLTTVQALALMSVREAGCGREAKGWVYSGMSFRMACDMGLNLNTGQLTTNRHVNGDEAEEDVRRITFWGCFLFDKCWSNYLGRLPQLTRSIVTVPKFEVFPDEDSAQWSPYTDSGFTQGHSQAARTRAVALQISKLCEINGDLMQSFYNPTDMDKSRGRQVELKRLSDIHTRLEAWRRELPKEMEPREGGLPSILVMHMFFQLLFIHLFRPFLKYTQATSPLPPNVSPRKLCTQAAAMISKLLRLYKRSHGLRQVLNIVIYIAHSACTIHLLSMPDKHARRDVVHGVKHLEEMAESWLGARRSLGILGRLARRWNVELPDEAAAALSRTDAKFGPYRGDGQSPAADPPSLAHVGMSFAQANPPANGKPVSQTSSTVPPTTSSLSAVTPATSGPPVRPQSANHRPPPQDANSLLAQQYPSAAATPQEFGRNRSNDSSRTGRSAASPSDIFGGIDQLIRDSQDWAYRDQVQLATGLGNWNGIDSDPSSWMNAAIGEGLAPGGSAALGAPPAATVPATTGNMGFAMNGMTGASGYGLTSTWANGITPYNPLMDYNEDEWYQ